MALTFTLQFFSTVLNHGQGLELLCGQVDCLSKCYVALQLGFGSFLGIIGSNLIENKRQMVSFHHCRKLNVYVDD